MPVINENDTVATTEIRYGDNDRLAARVATMAGADLLVLLSDIDGLYNAPPGANPERETHPGGRAHHPRDRGDGGRRRVRTVARRHAHQDRGGKIATTAGTHMIIASGKIEHPLQAIADGGRCTWFLTPANPVTARKSWIAGSLEPKGTLTIDAGAVTALRAGKSLLPAGVTRVEGHFARGDAVHRARPDGARDRPRPGRLRCRRCRAGSRAQSSAEIAQMLGVTRPRRNDPSRRSRGRWPARRGCDSIWIQTRPHDLELSTSTPPAREFEIDLALANISPPVHCAALARRPGFLCYGA